MNYEPVPQPAEQSPSLLPVFMRRIGRVVLPLLALALVFPAQVYAAPTPSLLSQQPRFMDVSVESNVLFLMDDSRSMDDIQLPIPAGLTPAASPATLPANCNAGDVVTRSGCVPRELDWIHRSSALNPLYYNPAITYTPWNDNGRSGESGRFRPASTAKTDHNDDFIEGLVRHDMRYAGPNYSITSGASNFNGANRLSTFGANPPAAPGYLTARPANGGFTGASSSNRQQDIFSSPLLSGRCSAPVAPDVTAQPTSARTTVTQSSVFRTTSPQLSTPRTTATQPSTPRTSSTPTAVSRPIEYSIETPQACGVYGDYFVLAVPPSGFCNDPNSEGLRAALVQSRLQPCPTGTTTSGNDCLTCASGTTISGSQCLSNCPMGTVGSTNSACYSACAAPSVQTNLGTCSSACDLATTVGSNTTSCFQACGSGTSQTSLGTCASNCATGTFATSDRCYSACPTGYTQTSPGTCASDCVGAVSSNSSTCFFACPTGTLSGGQCRTCPAGTGLTSSNDCCPLFNGSARNWYPSDAPALANYFVFVPPELSRAPTAAELSDPANYERREINRDAPRYVATFQMPYRNNDPTQGRTKRARDPLNPDDLDTNGNLKPPLPNHCTAGAGDGTVCTWEQEAQNFANWYTYYRTRLFSAIAVSAASLSNLTQVNGLDSLRLGYGSINYFPSGFNPFPNFDPTRNTAFSNPLPKLDGQDSVGHIVRGVRPFTELVPPPAPGSRNFRQEAFDWLFSLRSVSSTPNREALDAAGRYFARDDDQSPWIEPDPVALNNGKWQAGAGYNKIDDIPCRRNYTLLITDGEWTNAHETTGSPQQQPVLGGLGGQRLGAPPATMAAQSGTPLNSLTTVGPVHKRASSVPGLPDTYQYLPANEPQFSGGAAGVTRTLSDVAHYYWSHDLRPDDLENNIRPSASDRNPAFWQHMSTYIVGYGISASRDNAATRSTIAAGTAFTWPGVTIETRPTSPIEASIITDRDASPINCNYDPITNPSGCGRVDDTFRAALAARGDFLAATDVDGLAASIAAAFARIGEVEGAATSYTGRSAAVRTDDRLYSASFVTNRWVGRLEAFDAPAVEQAATTGGASPAALFFSNFPGASSRNIITSTDVTAAVRFNWASITTAQQGLLNNNESVLAWLRGDHSTESRNGGSFRNRTDGDVMADVVNSNPVFSHSASDQYSAVRRPAASQTSPTTNAAVDYPAFVELNRQSRPAAVYVGANGGMLHAFNANDLSERFAYVPRAVYPRLNNLVQPGYVHRYYVDGPVVTGDVYIGGAWRTVLVGTTGAGPKGVFALDITQRSGASPRDFDTGDVLWDIVGTDTVSNIGELGHITQGGVIGSGRDGEWYYFTGNGWESTNDKARLLAIRIRDGAILSIETDSAGGDDPVAASVNDRPNGLGGVTAVYDSARNVVGIYAGDRLGRLWKFDLSSRNNSEWKAFNGAPIFTAEDGNLKRQPISTAPRVTAHPFGGRLILVGTGRLTESADTGDTGVQSIYAIWEKNPTSPPVSVSKSALRQFSFTETGRAEDRDRKRSLQGIDTLNWATDQGWRVDLRVGTQQLGERIIATPISDSGFIEVTSFEPIAGFDRCQGGGASFRYCFDVAGNFSRACFISSPSSVVGSEVLGTVGGLRIIRRARETTADSASSLTEAEIRDGLNSTLDPTRSGVCDSRGRSGAAGRSIRNVGAGQGTAAVLCQAQRVWRELPRGRR